MAPLRSAANPAALDEWEARFLEREPEIRAFVDEPERFARARDAAKRAPRGRLTGLLLGVKDIFHVDGLPTRAGSALPVSVLTGDEGPVVAALRAAGAVVAGKTVTTEFAYFAPGPTRNPANPEHTPGGSSSGSAAAVAAGLCDLAIGTQTIGSIGRPAAYCGVVGWKPSYERTSREGAIALAPSVDHVGLFARDVATITEAASVIASGWRSISPPPARPSLAVPEGPYLDALTPEGQVHFARVRDRLAQAGFAVVGVEAMGNFQAIVERHRRLVAFECAEVHADWFARFGDLYAEKTAELIRRGQTIPAEQARVDKAGRGELRATLERAMDEQAIDLWLSPPATGPAPRGLGSTGDPIMNLPWTHAGLPTLVVPAGRNDAGLPMGAQLAARFGRDEELLAWGAGIAKALARENDGGDR